MPEADILDEKYSARPGFEDDELIVGAFTQYVRDKDEPVKFRKEPQRLQNE